MGVIRSSEVHKSVKVWIGSMHLTGPTHRCHGHPSSFSVTMFCLTLIAHGKPSSSLWADATDLKAKHLCYLSLFIAIYQLPVGTASIRRSNRAKADRNISVHCYEQRQMPHTQKTTFKNCLLVFTVLFLVSKSSKA